LSPKIRITNEPHKTQLNMSFFYGVIKLADIAVFFVKRNKITSPKNLEYWKTEISE